MNAASKSAMLGEMDDATTVVDQALKRLKDVESKRGGNPSPDHWERVTEPEALLIKGDWEQAVTL